MNIACSTTVGYKQKLASVLQRIQESGFTTVDLLAIDGWAHINPHDLADQGEEGHGLITDLLARYRLSPIALNIGTRTDLHDRSAEAIASRSREMTTMVRLMNVLSVPIAVIQPRARDASRPYADVVQACAATWREMEAIAGRSGAKLALELHVFSPFEMLDQARALIELVPDLQVVYDPSHLVMQGVPLRETEWLMDRSIHVHLRDAAYGHMQTRLGQGSVDFEWVFHALKRRGYSGPVSIEYLQEDHYDVFEDVRRLKTMAEQKLDR
ncbi:sugar phosphate isomerase/epimerase family protein [Paenibacillus sp. 1P07SE]|uniref:sugar phosphate isomerase/epimerase family protein n=1 Tax=Paenibacillus sp. 1P07SE TaxID=3132209 RepID=UPI0039A4D2F9